MADVVGEIQCIYDYKCELVFITNPITDSPPSPPPAQTDSVCCTQKSQHNVNAESDSPAILITALGAGQICLIITIHSLRVLMIRESIYLPKQWAVKRKIPEMR